MAKNLLGDKAWENFCATHGWSRYWGESGRFDVFVTIDQKNLGKPYPLSVHHSYLSSRPSNENRNGWAIPERYARIGIYLGRLVVHQNQKTRKMTFATPTKDGNYSIYVAHSGIIDWFGGGEDEPCEQSGIRVDAFFVTNEQNTRAINTRFGNTIRDLSLLVEANGRPSPELAASPYQI